jgi:hypothetical protein
MRTLGNSRFGTGRWNSSVNNYSMTKLGNYPLRNEYFTTVSALLARGIARLGAGCILGFTYYYSIRVSAD